MDLLERTKTDRPAQAAAPSPTVFDVEDRIRSSIVSTAACDAWTITVTLDGSEATLTGEVHSNAEKQQASRAARLAPHVTQVSNLIQIVGPAVTTPSASDREEVGEWRNAQSP